MKTINLAAMLLLLLLASPLCAATLTVTNLNDSGAGSLRAQCAAAASGDTIVFQPGLTGTITFTWQINLGAKALIIVGNTDVLGAPAITLDGNNASRLLAIDATTLEISSLKLINGNATSGGDPRGGAIWGLVDVNFGSAISITCTNCVFSGNAAGSGGAIYAPNTTVTCTDCVFSNNSSATKGGAITAAQYVKGVTCTDCTFSGNSGGAIRADHVTCTGCEFDGTTGPAIEAQDSIAGGVTLTDCTFTNGSASLGAAVWVKLNSLTCTDCDFSGNTAIAAGYGGGAILLESGNLTCSGCAFTANSGERGGGIYSMEASAGALTCTDCSFSGNTATLYGGAIFSVATASCTGCTFSTNTAARSAGAIQAAGVTCSGCTFTSNSVNNLAITDNSGGAIVCNTASCTGCVFSSNNVGGNNTEGGAIWASVSVGCTACTFSGNTMNSLTTGNVRGGAIFSVGVTCSGCTFSANGVSSAASGFGGAIHSSGVITLTDSTFAANYGVVGRCVYAAAGASLTSTNSIFADAGAGSMFAGVGSLSSGGYNICTALGASVPWMNTTGDQVNTDPMLGGLQNNGGTVPTMRPLIGSPALDKGGASTTTVDARGAARPMDNPGISNASGGDGRDIGAVEYQFNFAPAIAAPGSVGFVNTDGATFDFSGGNVISISDADAAQVEVTLSVTGGTLTLSQTTGLNFTTGDGDSDATMVFTGNLTDINSALDGMEFSLLNGPNGGFTLDLDVDDQGATFDDTDKTDSESVIISVTAPVLDVRHSGSGYDSGDTLAVGNVIVGDDAMVLLRLRNVGDATLNITTPLGLSAETNCGANVTVPSTTIAAGDDYEVTVTITPAAAAAFSVLLTITSDDPVNPAYTLTLSGTALDPQALQVTRGLIILADGGTDDLGALTAGVKSKFIYTLTNTGDVTLTLDGPTSIVSTTNCKISIAAGVATTLAPGSTMDVTVFVKPTTEGMFSAAISIATNDGDSPFNLTLQGSGLPDESTTGNSDDSGGCAAGASTLPATVLVLVALVLLRRRREQPRVASKGSDA